MKIPTAHKTHRRVNGRAIPNNLAHEAVLLGRVQYKSGPRAGQQRADARKLFDANKQDRELKRGWVRL